MGNSQTCGKHLAVCFQNRLNQTSVKAGEVIDSGMLGRIKGIKGIVTWYRDGSYYTKSGWRGDRERAGSVLITRGLHTLDLMQWFCGEAERIMGHADNRCFRSVIEVEDTAEATIWFKNGPGNILRNGLPHGQFSRRDRDPLRKRVADHMGRGTVPARTTKGNSLHATSLLQARKPTGGLAMRS